MLTIELSRTIFLRHRMGMENTNTAQTKFADKIIAQKIKYCLYARKSTESDELQALSIESQVKEIYLLQNEKSLRL
jgi:hypothetical protein